MSSILWCLLQISGVQAESDNKILRKFEEMKLLTTNYMCIDTWEKCGKCVQFVHVMNYTEVH
jgi:hypothetical protein